MSELGNGIKDLGVLLGAVRALQVSGHDCAPYLEKHGRCLVCAVVHAKTNFVMLKKREPLTTADSATGDRARGTTLQQDGRGHTWRVK